MRKLRHKVYQLFVLTCAIGFAWAYVSWQHFLTTPVIPRGEIVIYTLPIGGNIKTVARDLHRRGFLRTPRYLVWLAYFHFQTRHIQAGEYAFEGGLTPRALINKLVEGRVLQHQLTLVEGWNIHQVLDAVQSNTLLKHELKAEKSLSKVINSTHKNLEGLLFPDTYSFTRGMSDVDLLRRTYKTMATYLKKVWPLRASNLVYKTPYDALIVASMIEKETAVSAERPIIAEIILKRLKKNMLLQIDPTVIYGLGKRYKGVLSKKDLRNKSPYNTYRYKGLPPTPIAMPGKASIDAALHPANKNYLYFVAKGDGSHQFSSTLKQHLAAVRQLRRKIK